MNVNDPIPSIHDWEAYSNHPVIKAKRAEDAARYKAYLQEESKRVNAELIAIYAATKKNQDVLDELSGEKAKREAAKQAEIDEYNKLFDADKQRFLDQGYSEEIAFANACQLALWRENNKLGYSND